MRISIFYYYPQEVAGLPAGSMVISGRDCPSSRTVALRFEGVMPETGTLNFEQPSYADSCSPGYRQFIADNGEFLFENLISGSMNLTSFTPRQPNNGPMGKIEGTFEFSVANEDNDSIINITDGAFRFKVPNTF